MSASRSRSLRARIVATLTHRITLTHRVIRANPSRPARRLTRLSVLTAALATLLAMAIPGGASAAGQRPGNGQPAGQPPEPIQTLPVNICNNSALPQDYGTNFPTPSDPYGFGYANQTVIGWEGNYYAPFDYLSGSYFARGVPDTYQPGGHGQSYAARCTPSAPMTTALRPVRRPQPARSSGLRRTVTCQP